MMGKRTAKSVAGNLPPAPTRLDLKNLIEDEQQRVQCYLLTVAYKSQDHNDNNIGTCASETASTSATTTSYCFIHSPNLGSQQTPDEKERLRSSRGS